MKQQLRRVLSQRKKKRLPEAGRISSAVLLPIFCKDELYHILFTKRTDMVKTHKGHICFPGGTYEEEDGTLSFTALRETAEEVGLRPEDVEIIGELDDVGSLTTNYVISPFVGFIPWPYNFVLNEKETERILEVPVSALLDGNCVHKGTEFMEGESVTSYFYHYRGDIIWGATARILTQFLDILVKVTKESKTTTGKNRSS